MKLARVGESKGAGGHLALLHLRVRKKCMLLLLNAVGSPLCG